jgi:hypothetical protein
MSPASRCPRDTLDRSHRAALDKGAVQQSELRNKILREMKSADIPIEQSTKFHRISNFITAKTLGLGMPQARLAIADELTE